MKKRRRKPLKRSDAKHSFLDSVQCLSQKIPKCFLVRVIAISCNCGGMEMLWDRMIGVRCARCRVLLSSLWSMLSSSMVLRSTALKWSLWYCRFWYRYCYIYSCLPFTCSSCSLTWHLQRTLSRVLANRTRWETRIWMNRIGFISVNHFWTLTHEVGFHLHNTPTALTNTSIQTALTCRSIRTENSRKKKNEERDSQVFLEFF